MYIFLNAISYFISFKILKTLYKNDAQMLQIFFFNKIENKKIKKKCVDMYRYW